MMGYIAAHDTRNALELFNKLYADGKEMGALLDELACLARDLLILKTAPDAGLAMLSGVASDREASGLVNAISSAELVRMMELLETTMSGFTRSASRRMDAELCLIRMCQPELQLDAESLNARLTRMEEQLKSGNISVAAPAVPVKKQKAAPVKEETSAAPHTDAPSVKIDAEPAPVAIEEPVGFWAELVSAIRLEMKPPMVGFFTTGENAPVKGVLRGQQIVLQCSNGFTMEMVNKPEVLAMVERKAAAILGQAISVKAEDVSASPKSSEKMERLMNFGRAHSDVVKIKEN